jgi:aminomethyltransferase
MEEGGWWWAEGFGDDDGEYQAVREDLGVWDVSPLNKWVLTGPDALAAAQRLHTNNVAGMAVGQVRYGAICDEDGLMVDDATVFRLEDRVWVMTGGAEHLDYFAAATAPLDVHFELVTVSMPHIGLLGPRARQALAPLCEADISRLGYYRFIPSPTRVGGVPCVVSRTGFGGELGYELFCRPEHAADLWQVAVDQMKARAFGVTVLEPLRVEAGLIVRDYDYTTRERSPYDLSMDKMIVLGNDEVIGHEALRKVAAAPPRRLMTLELASEDLPDYGAEVTLDGEPVGVLTSPAVSPRFGPIALAIVETHAAREGNQVDVATESRPVAASVARLSIYDPEKRRPRA